MALSIFNLSNVCWISASNFVGCACCSKCEIKYWTFIWSFNKSEKVNFAVLYNCQPCQINKQHSACRYNLPCIKYILSSLNVSSTFNSTVLESVDSLNFLSSKFPVVWHTGCLLLFSLAFLDGDNSINIKALLSLWSDRTLCCSSSQEIQMFFIRTGCSYTNHN